MNQQRKPGKQRSSSGDLRSPNKTKEIKKGAGNLEEHLKKLDEMYAKLEGKPGFEKFLRARGRLEFTIKDRFKARDEIHEVKGEFDGLKDKVKGFLKEQLVNSHKSTVQRPTKPKLQQN